MLLRKVKYAGPPGWTYRKIPTLPGHRTLQAGGSVHTVHSPPRKSTRSACSQPPGLNGVPFPMGVAPAASEASKHHWPSYPWCLLPQGCSWATSSLTYSFAFYIKKKKEKKRKEFPDSLVIRSSLLGPRSNWRGAAAAAKSRQSCPTRCDSIDGSPTGSSIPGILQARTQEWVASAFSIGEVGTELRSHKLPATAKKKKKKGFNMTLRGFNIFKMVKIS